MYYIEDTNVISKAASDEVFLARLDAKRRELEGQGFAHAIAPPMLVELIEGLAGILDGISGGNDAWGNFVLGKHRLRILYPWDRPSSPKILAYPNAFVLKTILGIECRGSAILNAEYFQRLVDVAYAAQSPRDIWTSRVRIDPEKDPKRYGMNRDSVRQRREKEYLLHLSLMREARAGKPAKNRDEFVLSTIVAPEQIPSPNALETTKLSAAIDAAYCYYVWLFKNAKNSYNFEAEKRKGDAMDYTFLLYLADPGVRFLTQDSKIKSRVGESPQAEQIVIMSFAERPMRLSMRTTKPTPSKPKIKWITAPGGLPEGVDLSSRADMMDKLFLRIPN